MTEKLCRALLGVTILGACLAAAAAGWWNSATSDEPYFLLGAHAAVEGKGLLMVVHPPLYELPAGGALHLLPLHPPPDPDATLVTPLPVLIHRFLHENRVPALAMLRVARTGMLVFLVLFLWGVFRLGQLLGGTNVGLGATLAVACQPLVLGHAFVVHTDVPAAACWVWACVYLERVVQGHARAVLGLGLWLGLALAAKHSGVLLVLVALLRVLAAALQRKPLPLGGLLLALVLALLVPVVLSWWTLRHVTAEQERALLRLFSQKFGGLPWVVAVLGPMADVCKGCAHWLLGFVTRLWISSHGQGVNYFWGKLSPYGFAWYFPVALVAKLSAPLTVLWLAALGKGRRLPEGVRWLAVYTGLYLLAALGSAFNIGARHLLPVVGFLGVLAGVALVNLKVPGRAVALAGLLASPVWSFPHYIPHFSLFVGGPRGGSKILHDSNFDWGQDWARLARVSQKRGWHPLYAVYLGPDDPGGYGVPMENLLVTGNLPGSGYVAVSSWAATVGPAYLRYAGFQENARFAERLLDSLKRCPVVARVGHTIAVHRCEEATGEEQEPMPPPPTPRE